jgi:uncharacterized protein
VPLPPPIAARGAPPHWLGYIGVEDVVGTALRFVHSGATQLGPPARTAHANPDAILRDPVGAIVGLTDASTDRADAGVAWHLLSARDEEQAFAVYADLFAWTRLDSHDLGPKRGRHVTFAWDGSPRAVGSTADVARQPHVHPQWLFFFPTEDLERSLAAARAMDALTLPPTETATGDLVAACDDPQGAAFGLYQAATPNLQPPTSKAR